MCLCSCVLKRCHGTETCIHSMAEVSETFFGTFLSMEQKVVLKSMCRGLYIRGHAATANDLLNSLVAVVRVSFQEIL